MHVGRQNILAQGMISGSGRFGSKPASPLSPAPLFTSCVSLVKSLNLSECQRPYLQGEMMTVPVAGAGCRVQ